MTDHDEAAKAELRAVRPDEYDLVRDLWGTVWGYGPYFNAYLEGDPWHQDRYCRIAKVDGKVVSCVVVCRRPIRHGDREWIMGGIANVSTLPDHRRKGYSAELLRQVVAVMEEDGFDYSVLGTGIHHHYAKHGWFSVTAPLLQVKLSETAQLPEADVDIVPMTLESWLDEAPPVYAAFNASLALCFERSLEYWNGWLKIRSESWGGDSVFGLRREGVLEGYLLASIPNEAGGEFFVKEYAAVHREDVPRLLAAGIRAARTSGASCFTLRGPKLPLVESTLPQWGAVEVYPQTGTMLRKVRADDFAMQEISRDVEMGLATWWGPDDF